MNGYKKLLLDAQPTEGDDAIYRVIVIVFTDLPAERAQDVFDEVLKAAGSSVVCGPSNSLWPVLRRKRGDCGLQLPRFRPFQSPVPFLFVRYGVISDWKFFLDDEEALNRWARQYGEYTVPTLAKELRRTNWRQLGA